MSTWQPIHTAPQTGEVIDVWLIGELEDIEFYCATPEKVRRRNEWHGRAPDWHWHSGKWRPHMRGLGMPVFTQPKLWMPRPANP